MTFATRRSALTAVLKRALVFFVLSLLAACGGCEDLIDPTDLVDVKQYYPDIPVDGSPDAGNDLGSDDAGQPPKDAEFVFDFGDPQDMGDQPFALTAVVPNFGPVSGGTQVRITGTGLKEDSRVLVGSREMDVNLAAGTLVGRVPPGAGPGAASVKVVAPDGEIRVLVDAYTYVSDLSVTEVSPAVVPTTGGVEVSIYGTGFAPQTGVSFSGDEALRVTVVDDTFLRVLTPPRPRGVADVRVTTPADSVELEDGIRYFDPLQIDAVEPASGMTAGGESVLLRGTGFTSDAVVRFGGLIASTVSVNAQAGTMTVTTPAQAAGTVDVFVQNSVDSAVREDGYTYRVDATPFIASVFPRTGPISGGNTVRVGGFGMNTASAEIRFDGVPGTITQSAAS